MSFRTSARSRNMKNCREGFKSEFEQRINLYNLIKILLTFSTAPIQFPANPRNELRELQQEEQQRRIIAHINDKQALIPHPYERLALNYRTQQLQRFDGKVRKLQTSLNFFQIKISRRTINSHKYSPPSVTTAGG